MLSREIASDMVSLPGGLAITDGRCLTTAGLRPLTGREEDWLARHPDAPSAVAVTHILAGCLLDLDGRRADASITRQLLVGDRDFLMLKLRALTLGHEFQAIALCPSCGEKMDVGFQASEVPITMRAPVRADYGLDLSAPGGGVRHVRFRLPTGADQEAVLHLNAGAACAALFERCVMSNDGAPFTAAERDEIEAAIEREAPGIDLELDLTCPSCGAAFMLPFDTTAFFLQEVRSGSRWLLREFHSLAFHYHWSESEILAMDRTRRRAYLGLLSDELRRH